MSLTRWISGLLIICLIWAWFVMVIYEGGIPLSVAQNIGEPLGGGGSVFVIGGIGAAFIYALSKHARAAMWAWTIVVSIAIVVITIGTIYGASIRRGVE